MITYLFLAIFLGLIAYFVYFQMVRSEEFINSPYNKRTDSFAKEVTRGTIYASNDTVLAQTVVNEAGEEKREYPQGNLYAHVVGYHTHGKAGIESTANFYLLRSHIFPLEKITNDILGKKDPGDDVYTTLDTQLQQVAYQALGSFDGAVVVLEPSTGKILAMVSRPDFDPNQIQDQWDSIVNSQSSVLVNRATQGLYPPGSTFKILTALEYMREQPDYAQRTYDCSGSVTMEDSVINCYAQTAHGTEDLNQAFARSCNSFFATIGMELDRQKFQALSEKFLFNEKLPLTMEYKKSSFSLDQDAETSVAMQTCIGQGRTLVSPVHMAMIVSAIANDGILMRPYVIDHIESAADETTKEFAPAKYGKLLDKEEAQQIKGLMRQVVTAGTAQSLQGRGYAAYGKTGSAEFNDIKGQSHAWFVGFASREEGQKADLAVAVIAEGAGAGGTYAVPIAQQIFDSYYSREGAK